MGKRARVNRSLLVVFVGLVALLSVFKFISPTLAQE